MVHDLRAAHALMLGLEQRGLVERRGSASMSWAGYAGLAGVHAERDAER
jgi:hypothetical protein